MNIQNFNVLSQNEKEYYLFEDDKVEFLFVHSVDNKKYGLYGIGIFFVEVVCDSDSLIVLEINSFDTGPLLDKYSQILNKTFPH